MAGTDLPPEARADAGRRVVRLVGLPADLFHELEVHFEDLVRELQIIAVGGQQGLGILMTDAATPSGQAAFTAAVRSGVVL